MFSELMPGILDHVSVPAGSGEHETLAVLWRSLYNSIPNPGWQAFAFSVSFAALCFIPGWLLYRKKIFVKV